MIVSFAGDLFAQYWVKQCDCRQFVLMRNDDPIAQGAIETIQRNRFYRLTPRAKLVTGVASTTE